MSITTKDSFTPWPFILKITFCLGVIFFTDFHIGNSQAFTNIFKEDIAKTDLQHSVSLANIQENSTDTQSPFFWHFVWLGSVLSVCGVIGLSAISKNLRPFAFRTHKLQRVKEISKHIPIHG